MVFCFTTNYRPKMNNILCTKNVFFEPEIFPAILLSTWKPAHVTLFANGRGMITGVKNKVTAIETLYKVCGHLTQDSLSAPPI